jgi:hypothetical protein
MIVRTQPMLWTLLILVLLVVTVATDSADENL